MSPFCSAESHTVSQPACAASAKIDLFLKGDLQLVGLYVPGVQFIADFNTPVL
jgi:hypothetical protein